MECFARDCATGIFLVLKVVFSADRFVLKILVHIKILLLVGFRDLEKKLSVEGWFSSGYWLLIIASRNFLSICPVKMSQNIIKSDIKLNSGYLNVAGLLRSKK